MTAEQLASELRDRLRRQGLVEQDLLDRLPDDQVIDCYVTCSSCGHKLLSGRALASAIVEASSAEEFIAICDARHGH
jgi:hypothetical protein